MSWLTRAARAIDLRQDEKDIIRDIVLLAQEQVMTADSAEGSAKIIVKALPSGRLERAVKKRIRKLACKRARKVFTKNNPYSEAGRIKPWTNK